MININLCTIPFISTDYSNVLDFENLQNRDNYFKSKTLLTLNNVNMKYDNERTYVVINIPSVDCRHYDYLWYYDTKGKPWFYFITNIEQVTINQTKLYLSLDIWTSYLKMYDILPSFVDRCHVPRWNGDIPTYNMEDEGIEIGEYIQISEKEDICDMKNSLIISSSVPIGYIPSSSSGGGGDGSLDDIPSNPTIDGNDKKRLFVHALYKGACEGYNSDNLFTSVTLGMAIEESGWGTSDLAKNAFNYFGQKWVEGAEEDYYINPLDGIKYRKYKTPYDGARALLKFLKDYDRYKDVFNAKTPREQITKIQQAGYNPNPSYIDSIMTLIEQNNLTVYDVKLNESGVDGYKSYSNAFGNGWLCPVKGGKVTSKYGWRVHPITGVKTFHHGTDIGLPTGSPTVASTDGIISETGYHNSMGNYIYLDYNGYRTKYMHLSKILVNIGDMVKRGQKIGEIGSTGGSTGSHSHWEIRRISDNESTDPAPSLNKGDNV